MTPDLFGISRSVGGEQDLHVNNVHLTKFHTWGLDTFFIFVKKEEHCRIRTISISICFLTTRVITVVSYQ